VLFFALLHLTGQSIKIKPCCGLAEFFLVLMLDFLFDFLYLFDHVSPFLIILLHEKDITEISVYYLYYLKTVHPKPTRNVSTIV
jgi:hypothetical protein